MSAIIAGVGLLFIAFLSMAIWMYAVTHAIHHRRWILALLIGVLPVFAWLSNLVDSQTVREWARSSSFAFWLAVGYAVFHRCPRRSARAAPS